MNDPVPREKLAQAAMKAVSEAHPDLTIAQLMRIMSEAQWDFDATPVTFSYKLPNDDPAKVVINLVGPPTD